jgi:BASS family bile acid:Na+ symporter
MDPLTKTFTLIFLITTMASIGLKVTMSELVLALGDRSLMIRSLVVNLIIVPLVGLLLVTIVPLSQDVKVGILLLAVTPGGLNAIQFTSKTKDALCYAASLLFILTLLAVLSSPVIVSFTFPVSTSFSLRYGTMAMILFLCVLLPLLAGLGVHRVSKRIAQILSKPVAIIGTVLFVVVVVRMMAQRKQAMAALSKTELAAMIGFILITMIIGWLLGGPSIETRRVLATTTSMRNAALCFIMATRGFPDTNVIVTVVAFSGLMIFPNMLLTVYEIILEKKSSRRSLTENRISDRKE